MASKDRLGQSYKECCRITGGLNVFRLKKHMAKERLVNIRGLVDRSNVGQESAGEMVIRVMYLDSF